MQIGISEQDMALEAGLTEEYYRRLEQENQSVPQKVRKRLKDALIRLHPEPLTLLFDYVRIRFPTMDVKHIIEDVLRLKMKYLVQEPRGMYGYTSTYQIGDVLVLTSPLEEMGVLLELRGKGCRQFEAYLDGQKRTWYEFFRKCMKEKAVFKRVDLAVNDLGGDAGYSAAHQQMSQRGVCFRVPQFSGVSLGRTGQSAGAGQRPHGRNAVHRFDAVGLVFLPLRESLRAVGEKRYAVGTGRHSESL